MLGGTQREYQDLSIANRSRLLNVLAVAALSISCGSDEGNLSGPRESSSSEDQEAYLGSLGLYSNEYMTQLAGRVPEALVGGPGAIVGSLSARGIPIEGVSLRLILNDIQPSQWAQSDSDGIYAVPVPFGEYKVSGWELEASAANDVLSGLTSSPDNFVRRSMVIVSAGMPGVGPDLVFDEPVLLLGPTGRVDVSDPVVVTWEPHPRADRYRISLFEIDDPESIQFTTLFINRRVPATEGTSLNLSEIETLQDGFYYMVVVDAVNQDGLALASSGLRVDEKDFRFRAQ